MSAALPVLLALAAIIAPPGLAGLPPQMQVAGGMPAATAGRYLLRGDRSLFPASIGDDGQRTLIDWPATGPLPAVYSRDASGRETLVNGNMRGALFVIDDVADQLVFRVDKRVAQAIRTPSRTAR